MFFRSKQKEKISQDVLKGTRCHGCVCCLGANSLGSVACTGYPDRHVQVEQCQRDRRNQERIIAAAEAMGMDPEEALAKIGYMKDDGFVFQPIPTPAAMATK